MPLTTHEISELEKWLASPRFKGRAMRIDRLEGFLCAVISSPEIIPSATWIVEALGSEPEYDSPDQAREDVELLKRFYHHVGALLLESRPQLILKPLSDTKPDYQTWCEGYIMGWSLSSGEWLRPGNEALKQLTFPILYLSGAFEEGAERGGKEYVPTEEDLKVWQDCAATLPQAVAAIYGFWLSRQKAAPAKRDNPKIGRNDRCPCGSGKKFKVCCASPGRLH